LNESCSCANNGKGTVDDDDDDDDDIDDSILLYKNQHIKHPLWPPRPMRLRALNLAVFIELTLYIMKKHPILDANSQFDFEQIQLCSPQPYHGTHFSKLLYSQKPVFIKTTPCHVKAKFTQTKTKLCADLILGSDNHELITWLESLEQFCIQTIFDHRQEWFETPLEWVDIEQSFVSPLKSYKSGQYHILRTFSPVPLLSEKPFLRVFDERGQEMVNDSVEPTHSILCILEFQGVKCSTRSFALDVEIKQVLVLDPQRPLFEECLLSPDLASPSPMTFPAPTPTPAPTPEPIPSSDDDDETVKNADELTVNTPVAEAENTANETTVSTTTTPTEVILQSDESQNVGVVVVQEVAEPAKTDAEPAVITTQIPVVYPMDEEMPVLVDDSELFDFENESIDLGVVEIPEPQADLYEIYRDAQRRGKNARTQALASFLLENKIENKVSWEDEPF